MELAMANLRRTSIPSREWLERDVLLCSVMLRWQGLSSKFCIEPLISNDSTANWIHFLQSILRCNLHCLYVVALSSSLKSFFSLSFIHRCNEDDTLVYNYEESAVQQFTLDAFRFMGESADAVVYLHCSVEACRKGDNSSRCAQGCVEDNGPIRRRRDLVLDTVGTKTVTVGPVNKKDVEPVKEGES